MNLPFQKKLSASISRVQSKLLAVFPEEQLKELKEAEVTVLLEEVSKVEILSLTQSLLKDTVEEVDCETIDEKKCSFKQGLNSSFDCLPLSDLEVRLSIFGSFKKIFFEANLGWLRLLFFLFWIAGGNGAKWYDWNFADLTKVPNASLKQNNILKHFLLILLVLGRMLQLNKFLWLTSPTSG